MRWVFVIGIFPPLIIIMMIGRCLNHFRFHTSCQFQIYHKSSQQTISQKPILLCTDVYFFLQFCLKWLDKYLFRRTLAFFAHNPLHQPLDLEGVLECERVLLKWLVMHISKRTLFWSWRREAKEVPETSTSHNLLCGRQCAGARDCLANKKTETILAHSHWWILRLD